MPRKRREPSLLDLVPPIGGLIALGIFFVPGFRQLLGALLGLVLLLAILIVVGLIGRAIWGYSRGKAEQESMFGLGKPTAGTIAATVAPVYRAAFGNVNLMNPPRVVTREWSQELLSALEWKRFEDVVAAYSRELGYEAKTTRIGADGGVDVQLFQHGQPTPVMIIQCKAWDAYKVGVKPVRELFGVMAADRVANGAFFTTGDFTAEAEEWARDKNLDLVNGREFLSRISQLTPAASSLSDFESKIY